MSIKHRVAGTVAVLLVAVSLVTAGMVVSARDARRIVWRPQPTIACRAPLVAVARESGWVCGYMRVGAGGTLPVSEPIFYYVATP